LQGNNNIHDLIFEKSVFSFSAWRKKQAQIQRKVVVSEMQLQLPDQQSTNSSKDICPQETFIFTPTMGILSSIQKVFPERGDTLISPNPKVFDNSIALKQQND
jgi:hypothetical protein